MTSLRTRLWYALDCPLTLREGISAFIFYYVPRASYYRSRYAGRTLFMEWGSHEASIHTEPGRGLVFWYYISRGDWRHSIERTVTLWPR